MKVTCFQPNLYWGEPVKNMELIQSFVEHLSETPDVLVLPELWNTSYALQQWHSRKWGCSHEISFLQQLAKNNGMTIVGGSILEHTKEAQCVNRTYIISNEGHIISKYDKVHLFPLMNEEAFFKAGSEHSIFTIHRTVCSTFICYDLRFPTWIRHAALQGASVLFFVAQWPSKRLNVWKQLLIARAIENSCFVVACNRRGTDDSGVYEGGSLIIDPFGMVISEGGKDDTFISSVLNLSLVQESRSLLSALDSEKKAPYRVKIQKKYSY